MARTAEVKRDARIGEAEAKRDAQIKEAIAEEERMASRYTSIIIIFLSNNFKFKSNICLKITNILFEVMNRWLDVSHKFYISKIFEKKFSFFLTICRY